MASLAVKTVVGDVVRVADEVDVFEVTGKNRSMVLVTNARTKESARVHWKKILAVVQPEELAESDEALPDLAELLAEETAEDVQQSAKSAKKAAPKLNVAALVGAGHEVWTRRMTFDHAHVVAEAWYVFSSCGKKAWSFNTYDRSLGKRQKASTTREHTLANEFEIAKRKARLTKKGYSLFEGGTR
jgi:hypothetical protein